MRALIAAMALALILPGVASADVSFSTTNLGAGNRPSSIAVGDFNRDGDPDLAVTNGESDDVQVRLGRPGGSFAAATVRFVGDDPSSVAVGDFNGDGNPDLATANYAADNVAILLGDGTGGFGPRATFPAGDGPISIAVGQFNRDEDSHLDVVVADWGTGNFTTDYVNVLLGNGDGTLRARSPYEVGYNPREVAVGDINGDGDPDLAVTSEMEGSAGVLFGQSGGGFGRYSWTPANWGPRGIALGDFNRDGRGDMAVSNTYSHDISMMLGPTGGQTWGQFAWPVTHYAAGSGPMGMVAADFDGDALLDLAIASHDAHRASVLLGDGAAGLGAPEGFPTGNFPQDIATADFNGDSELDLAVANWGSHSVSILLNNDPPTAAGDGYATDEDTPLNVGGRGVLGNDSDPDGDDTLSAIVVSGPGHGSLQLNADGSFAYTPEANFSGSDSFTYRADDGSPDGATATVTIDVAAVADAPRARADEYTTGEDTPLTVGAPGVLGNDTDGDDDDMTAALVSGPAHGTLALNADGSFSYEPEADYHGPDWFAYRAGDGGLSSDATVTLTVAAANDAPVTERDTLETDEDTPLTVAAPGVLGNDADIDGDALTALAMTEPVHGSVELRGDGSLTYTPDRDWHGADSFTYRAVDGSISVPGQVVIVVRPVNDAPDATGDEYATDEDTSLTVDAPGVLANDDDVEAQAITAALVSEPEHGSVTLDADGSFRYTPDADFHGSDAFRYRASDGARDSGATVTLTVGAANDLPAAEGEVYATGEDAPLTVDAAGGVLANDGDPDGDELTATVVDGPARGRVQLSSDGSFVYTPDAEFHGSDSFRYRAGDGSPDGATAMVTIGVAAAADAPRARDDSYVTSEGVALRVDAPGVLRNDDDADGDALAAAVVSPPAHGSLELGADGSFAYTPAAGFSGRDGFSYRAGDGELESDATVTIDVEAAARAAASAPPLSACGMTGEVIVGTDGDDRRRGSSATDILLGGLGNDVLGGGAGRDCLVGGAGHDRLSGGAGRDRLHGGTGADRLDPGPGTDRVAAGPGNDRVITWGNMVDTIDCGPGVDIAIVDRLDRTRRCERVVLMHAPRGRPARSRRR